MKRALQEKFLLYKVRVKKDPDAFAKIYDLYATRIYRFVFFKVSSEEEAQDITADVFLKAWQYLIDDQGREVRHLGPLLYRIARNSVIDHYRSRASKETATLTPEAENRVSDEGAAVRETDARLDVEALSGRLQSLKDEYREVLVMRYLDEMATDEIAEALGKTPGNVRVLLHRAMQALKNLVEDAQGNPHNEANEKGPDRKTEADETAP